MVAIERSRAKSRHYRVTRKPEYNRCARFLEAVRERFHRGPPTDCLAAEAPPLSWKPRSIRAGRPVQQRLERH
jgi:hypothetical protein